MHFFSLAAISGEKEVFIDRKSLCVSARVRVRVHEAKKEVYL